MHAMLARSQKSIGGTERVCVLVYKVTVQVASSREGQNFTCYPRLRVSDRPWVPRSCACAVPSNQRQYHIDRETDKIWI